MDIIDPDEDYPSTRCACDAKAAWRAGLNRGTAMMRRMLLALVCAVVLAAGFSATSGQAQAQERAYSRVWGSQYGTRDWERFYHYPYVYYPQNFYGNEYYRSSEDLYYRYPQEMRVPVYNKKWHNYYPEGSRYHQGHQFNLDVF